MKNIQRFVGVAALSLTALVVSACQHKAAEVVGMGEISASARVMSVGPQAMMMAAPMPESAQDRESYGHQDENPVKLTSETPVSTFSVDVDTASYSNVRRILDQGQLPPRDAVRVEEMINYFSYHYTPPKSVEPPFSITTEIAPSPWNKERVLLQIGLQGYRVDRSAMPAANLVFLVDVSGSMNSPDKLGLLKYALKALAGQLSGRDRVTIVVYAGASGVVLETTPGNQRERIDAALSQLSAGGSTNGGEGIQLAYAMARASYIPDGINRIILATDGDFNVGTTDFEMLLNLVEEKRKSGISLTTLGFGTGNINDKLMEQLADRGNGNYAYIDTPSEARKVLVEQMGSNLLTIAKDVRIQVEFNPEAVAEYRLIGYENRLLNREDFNNDKVDAGEIGAGHSVTALYELTLKGGKGLIDPLRYAAAKSAVAGKAGELAFLRLRYKKPEAEESSLIERPVHLSGIQSDLKQSSDDFRFSASVAAFGQMLRGGRYNGSYSWEDLIALAGTATGKDESGYRHEFMQLAKTAASLQNEKQLTEAPSDPAIYFHFDSIEIDADGQQRLQEAAAYFLYQKRQGKLSRIRVEGNTGVKGSSEYNVLLAQRTADAAKTFLMKQGVPAEKIESVSFGGERPVCTTNTSEACQAQNGRVDIIFTE
ncbi:MAG: hypothetical protein CO187_01320 [Zetaproteobacteria bacterium CG_4_9_14_3_um_filter_53_7]|nr:MAG: hypothetical protein CO187_01320 [Zetaproteobacteria bacterium CG_4_9_14_3_um_filter_53_7]